MNNIIMNKRHLVELFILTTGILFFFFIINERTPLMGEDYALLAFMPHEEVHGFDIFVKMVWRIKIQMFGWNVRLGEQLSIVMGCFDKVLFNILNSFMATYYICLTLMYAYLFRGNVDYSYKKSTITVKHIIRSIFLVFFLIVLFQPALGEIFFWKTGSTNYLWALCILLTFTLPLWGYVSSGDIVFNNIKYPLLAKSLFVILGFFAGFTNENTVGAFWIVFLLVFIKDYKEKMRTPKWLYCLFFTFTLGFIFMLESPSTKHRVAYYKEVYDANNLTLTDYFIRAKNIVIVFLQENYIYLIVSILLIIIIYLCRDSKTVNQRLLFISVFVSFASCGALLMSPYIEIRAFFLSDFMMLVCIVYYFNLLIDTIEFNHIILKCTRLIMLIPLILCVLKIYSIYDNYSEYCIERDVAAKQADGPYYYVIYPDYIKSRVLTTREDYLVGNELYLDSYYGKDVTIIQY